MAKERFLRILFIRSSIRLALSILTGKLESLVSQLLAGGRVFNSQGRTITQGLKITKNERTPFALQAARPSRGSDDQWRSHLQLET